MNTVDYKFGGETNGTSIPFGRIILISSAIVLLLIVAFSYNRDLTYWIGIHQVGENEVHVIKNITSENGYEIHDKPDEYYIFFKKVQVYKKSTRFFFDNEERPNINVVYGSLRGSIKMSVSIHLENFDENILMSYNSPDAYNEAIESYIKQGVKNAALHWNFDDINSLKRNAFTKDVLDSIESEIHKRIPNANVESVTIANTSCDMLDYLLSKKLNEYGTLTGEN